MTTPYEQAATEVREGDAPKKPTIDVGGETFTLHGRLTSLDMSELARSSGVDSTSAEGATILAEVFRAAFGDHTSDGRVEYRRFSRHLRTLDDADEQMVDALGKAMEAFTGFPTPPPSPSPASPSATMPGSKVDGSPQDALGSLEALSVPPSAEVTEQHERVVVNMATGARRVS